MVVTHLNPIPQLSYWLSELTHLFLDSLRPSPALFLLCLLNESLRSECIYNSENHEDKQSHMKHKFKVLKL